MARAGVWCFEMWTCHVSEGLSTGSEGEYRHVKVFEFRRPKEAHSLRGGFIYRGMSGLPCNDISLLCVPTWLPLLKGVYLLHGDASSKG